jgi:hypothetical protein
MVNQSVWLGPADVKAEFGAAVDFVGDDRLIFNIAGNRYRLIVYVAYAYKRVLIKFIGNRGVRGAPLADRTGRSGGCNPCAHGTVRLFPARSGEIARLAVPRLGDTCKTAWSDDGASLSFAP